MVSVTQPAPLSHNGNLYFCSRIRKRKCLQVPRIIVHLHADAFFASAEQAADSRLRGKPVTVGGEKRGINASASYEARKFCLASKAMPDLPRVRWTGVERAATLRTAVSFLNANYLFASLIWGSVGMGYFIFGKKQQSYVPMFAGLVMIGVSYFVGSALVMSLICGAIIAAVYVLVKQGY
jgi:hypothetical protein